jgi:DNA ligase-1
MRWIARLAMLWLPFLPASVTAATPPQLELVDVYRGGIDLSAYWVSEKFDGVRGYWNGHVLLTRQGNRIDAPAWFTQGWPNTPLDGELWAGYGNFSTASVVVRTASHDDPRWHDISYRVFDLPAHGGSFDERVPAIRQAVAAINQPWVVAVVQFHVADEKSLRAELAKVLARGGEGLVLHRGDSVYQAGRKVGLLKLKPYEDAEAKVVDVIPGKGRLYGSMGALRVRTPDGREFAIGSGFSDTERAHPPAPGSWITYRFNGLTAQGLPRFARFLRPRPEGPPPEAEASFTAVPPAR